jgi:predicted deacylase
MSILQIGSIQAPRGQKASGYCSVSVGVADVRFPIVLINGAQPGARLALTAGVHYGEFLGIEALRNLLKTVDPTRLSGQIVACALANPPSSYGHRLISTPLDEINPNRVFPGSQTGKPTERMVGWLFENLVRPSDVYIDFHGGSISEEMINHVAYRTSGNQAQDRLALELAEAFGISDVVRGASPSGGNSHAAATREHIVALLIEAGEQYRRTPEEVAQIRDGVLRVMERLEMIETNFPALTAPIRHWVWAAEVEADVEGLWYPEFKIGDYVQKGAILGRIIDPLDNLLDEVCTPATGRVLYGERGLIVASTDILAAIAVSED